MEKRFVINGYSAVVPRPFYKVLVGWIGSDWSARLIGCADVYTDLFEPDNFARLESSPRIFSSI